MFDASWEKWSSAFASWRLAWKTTKMCSKIYNGPDGSKKHSQTSTGQSLSFSTRASIGLRTATQVSGFHNWTCPTRGKGCCILRILPLRLKFPCTLLSDCVIPGKHRLVSKGFIQSTKVKDALGRVQDAKVALEAEIPIATLNLHKDWHRELHDMLSNLPKPKEVLPCHMIDYQPNRRFVGRVSILKDMEEALANATDHQVSFALHGMGGVGKTQIALKYVHDHSGQFPAIFWMNADSRAKLNQSYVKAAKLLEIEPKDSQRDPDAVAQDFSVWLSITPVKWVIVYDNLDDMTFISSFWPRTKTGTVIVTSRNPNVASLATHNTPVLAMTPEEGKDLFMAIVRAFDPVLEEDIDASEVEEVTEKLGQLPLGIMQAASFMMERNCTVEDFLEVYNESLKDEPIFAGLDLDVRSLFYERSLKTVWSISIAKLSVDSTRLLSILSCLDPDGVPESLLRGGIKASTDLRHLAGAGAYSKATLELYRNGLIWKQNKPKRLSKLERGVRRVALHRLIQEVVFHQQDLAGQNRAFSWAVELCLNVFPHPTRSNFRLMHRWADCELYLPHLLALNARYRSTSSLEADSNLAELFLYAGWYLYERRVPEVALPLLESAWKTSERQDSGVDWFLRSRILSAFGCVLFECSRYLESESYFRKALELRLANVKQNDILLAHGYQDTALPLSGQGRYQEAIALQEKALEIIGANDDEDIRRDMMFHVHHNMGRTLEAAGSPEKALELHFKQGDEFGNGLRQEKSESGAVNLYAIGNCYLALGKYEDGVQYHNRSLQIRHELVGDHGFYYGISLHKMGCILYPKGELDSAKDVLEKARQIFSNSTDAKRELARTLWHLSIVERLSGGEASNIRQRVDSAWELRAELTGERQPASVEEASDDSWTAGFDKLVIYIHA